MCVCWWGGGGGVAGRGVNIKTEKLSGAHGLLWVHGLLQIKDNYYKNKR